jgi:benzoylformate decarboxylase
MAASAIAGQSMVGSVALAIDDLLAAGRSMAPPQQSGRVTTPRLSAAEPLTDAFLLQTLADLRAPDSIIVEEAPSSRPAMQQHLPILRSETFYTCSSGGLGHSLPAAVGVALGRPGCKVIAVIGDGSAMYSIQALWSAARLQLPITFIIVNNRRYKALDLFSQRFGVAQPVGTDLAGIDFVQLARAQGCGANRVTRAADLAGALQAALAAPGPMLLEVEVV